MSPETEKKLYWNPEKPWGHELLVNTLLDLGVEYIFTLTGGHIAPILQAAEDKGIKVISNRTEEGAVMAAIGYAISANKVGVACLTAGMTGFAHPAMLTASMAKVPVVVINGYAESYGDGTHQLQELDTKAIAQSAQVREAFHCTKWERIPQMTNWAFKAATGLVPGCAYIDFPVDLLCSQGDPETIKKWGSSICKARSQGDPDLVKEAIQMLLKATQPVINVGRLAIYAGAAVEIKEFVELTGIPVEACSGSLGQHPLNIAFQACGEADVVLMLGKVSTGFTGTLNFPAYTNAKYISVYPDPVDIGRCYPVEVGIAGDVRLVMRQMIEEARKFKFPDYSEWVAGCTGMREAMQGQFDSIAEESLTHAPTHPAVVVKTTVEWISDHKLNKDAPMVIDGADCASWWFMFSGPHNLPMEFPGQFMYAGTMDWSLGQIGAGLALAVGAACARPGKVILVPTLGDGAIGYHLAELETLARLKVPAVIVVHNNNSFGMVYADQRRIWGKQARAADFFMENIHFEKVAEALGCAQGEFATKPEEIRPALDRALERARKESKPVVVTCMTDPDIYVMEWPWMLLPATPEGEPYQGIGY
jgi:acetolactate synthase-1/2/3 large subunit